MAPSLEMGIAARETKAPSAKLEDNPAVPSLIITKWGVGYYLAE